MGHLFGGRVTKGVKGTSAAASSDERWGWVLVVPPAVVETTLFSEVNERGTSTLMGTTSGSSKEPSGDKERPLFEEYLDKRGVTSGGVVLLVGVGL